MITLQLLIKFLTMVDFAHVPSHSEAPIAAAPAGSQPTYHAPVQVFEFKLHRDLPFVSTVSGAG